MIPKTIDRPSSSFKLWDRRLDGPTLTRGQIRQYCNAIYAGAMGFDIGGHRTNLTPLECASLADKVRDRLAGPAETAGYGLEDDHTRFGLEWLRANSKRANRLGVSADMLESFTGFRFVGATIDRISPYGNWASVLPIYRVVSGAGWVDYSWSSWQNRAYG